MLRTKHIIKEEFKDLGLGTRDTGTQRLVNQDGSFNLERRGLPFFRGYDVYHRLISMSRLKFMSLILVYYLLVNLVFAAIYSIAGLNGLQGMSYSNAWDGYIQAFFFSAQTITTVGYGGIHPVGHMAATVAALESLIGLLTFAVATGLLYGRFSRPVARILFSPQAIIAPYRGISAFEFRIANKRSNQLIEIEAQVVLSRLEIVNGEKKRQYYTLELERSKINFFPSNWTIVHPITDKSPMYSSSPQQMIEEEAEFFVLLKAFDDTFSQTVYSRSSYVAEEVVWGAKFVNMFGTNEKGGTYFDLSMIGEFEKAPLPVEAFAL